MMQLIKYKLSDVAKIEISGVDKKTNDGETPVKLCNFTDVYNNWAITKDKEPNLMVASANDNEIRRFTLHKGQVAFTKDSETRDDIGISTYIADDLDNVLLGYHCALITPNESKALGAYINAFMHTSFVQKYFANNAGGSGQRYTLSVDTMENMPLLLPSIDNQYCIASLLSNLDRKISVAQSMNSNLMAIALQLYNYWFVQFDFPDTHGKPYKSSGGRMIYNPIVKREIPEGWEVKNIFDAANVLYGYPFNAELFTDDETSVPVVRIRDILGGSTSTYTTEDVNEKYRLHERDVIIGMDGNFHMNIWHNHSDYLNQRCVRLRPLEDSAISSFQVLFSIQPYIQAKEKTIKGSTVGHLSDKDMKELWVLQPTNFNPRPIFDNIANEIVKNRIEIASLTQQRNELLPLLMNGQVTVE